MKLHFLIAKRDRHSFKRATVLPPSVSARINSGKKDLLRYSSL